MPSIDPQNADRTARRGCRFTLLGIFVLTTFVAVVAAAATGAFGARVAAATCYGLIVVPMIIAGHLAVLCVFIPIFVLLSRMRSSMHRRRRGTVHTTSPPEAPPTDLTSE